MKTFRAQMSFGTLRFIAVPNPDCTAEIHATVRQQVDAKHASKHTKDDTGLPKGNRTQGKNPAMADILKSCCTFSVGATVEFFRLFLEGGIVADPWNTCLLK